MQQREPFCQTEEYQRGLKSQTALANLLKNAGWYVVPSYDYTAGETKAPKLQGGDEGGYVLPDLDVSIEVVDRYKTQPRRCWVEVKYKSNPSWYKKKSRFEFGISRRQLNDYRNVRRLTGCEVMIVVHEGVTGLILCQNLTVLDRDLRVYPGEGGGTCYVARSQFEELWRLHPSDDDRNVRDSIALKKLIDSRGCVPRFDRATVEFRGATSGLDLARITDCWEWLRVLYTEEGVSRSTAAKQFFLVGQSPLGGTR